MFDRLSPEEVVASLATVDCEVLSDREAVGTMVAAAAVAAWAESVVLSSVARLRSLRQDEYRAVRAAARPGSRPPDVPMDEAEVDRFCAAEVAVALRVSQRAALDRLRLADVLVGRLPGTLAGLGRGRLSLAHARAVADSLDVLDPGVALQVDGELMLAPASRTPPQLAADARRAAATIDPGYSVARCRQARAARRVSTWGLPDGVSALQVTGPSETVAGAWARIDAVARRMQDQVRRDASSAPGAPPVLPGGGAATGRPDMPSPGRRGSAVPSLDQLRADAVLGLLAGSPDLLQAASQVVAVRVDVVVPLATALGAGGAPAELPGVGPLPAEVGRALVAVADQVRVVELGDSDEEPVGPAAAGRPRAVSRADGAAETAYRPSAGVDRAVRLRDQTCRFPGCRVRAAACDVDHTVPHPQGPTAACNLACLCRTHHRLKHRGGWQVRQLGAGRLRWTSPTGRVTLTDPPSWCDALDRSPPAVLRT